MTPIEISYALNLAVCPRPKWCQEERTFLRQMADQAKHRPDEALDRKRVKCLGRVYWKYREELFYKGIQVVYGGQWPVLFRDGEPVVVTRIAKGPDAQWNIRYWAASDGGAAVEIELVEYAFCQAAGVDEVTVQELQDVSTVALEQAETQEKQWRTRRMAHRIHYA
jgi:hypothetical protein